MNSTSRIVALGTFDGVHRGHQILLKYAVQVNQQNASTAVFTFDIPPEHCFTGKTKLLVDFATKQKLIMETGIQEIAWVSFTKEFAALSAEDFIIQVLINHLKAKHLVCGFDYRFGAQAQGDYHLLQKFGKQYGFEVSVIAADEWDGIPVSSTRIRNALEAGNVELAATLLGRYHSYFGMITAGKQIGRELGFPTANLQVNPGLLIPKTGVYFTWCYLPDGTSYPAMTSVSNNPTVNGKETTIESYLIGFEGDLYGKTVELQFLEKIREIIRFPEIEQLKAQLHDDKAYVLSKLPNYHLQANRIMLK